MKEPIDVKCPRCGSIISLNDVIQNDGKCLVCDLQLSSKGILVKIAEEEKEVKVLFTRISLKLEK